MNVINHKQVPVKPHISEIVLCILSNSLVLRGMRSRYRKLSRAATVDEGGNPHSGSRRRIQNRAKSEAYGLQPGSNPRDTTITQDSVFTPGAELSGEASPLLSATAPPPTGEATPGDRNLDSITEERNTRETETDVSPTGNSKTGADNNNLKGVKPEVEPQGDTELMAVPGDVIRPASSTSLSGKGRGHLSRQIAGDQGKEDDTVL